MSRDKRLGKHPIRWHRPSAPRRRSGSAPFPPPPRLPASSVHKLNRPVSEVVACIEKVAATPSMVRTNVSYTTRERHRYIDLLYSQTLEQPTEKPLATSRPCVHANSALHAGVTIKHAHVYRDISEGSTDKLHPGDFVRIYTCIEKIILLT